MKWTPNVEGMAALLESFARRRGFDSSELRAVELPGKPYRLIIYREGDEVPTMTAEEAEKRHTI